MRAARTTSPPEATATSAQDLQKEIDAFQAAHEQFRTKVSEEVLRQRAAGTWCLPGTQDVLQDLGLPPIPMNYSGDATIHVRIVKISGASSRDEAEARVTCALS